ncbi:hypothetical protein JTE90_008375 [Oedothorax gibbosus]|uniref:tRNA (guanine(9)-N(1))-methyltransferase n=1 Tax=Oedothorax gibbosus TaxID=931172 RepID=A0AAV6V448_9ARAC|nr:hypothetical protein JTE90_008375 [Oedothorax gibbosus]
MSEESDVKLDLQNESATENPSEKPLSKNQLKKLEKRRMWLETKSERKAKEKLKRKLKIQHARETGQDLGPSRKLLKSLKMTESTCKLKVCFDLSLADVMMPPEFSKTFKQLHRCYSINRRAPAPLQLYITGYSDATKQAMSKMSGCFNWDLNFNPQHHTDIFDKDTIIYLTSDSPNVIESLDYDKVYIIGALVDHNRLKNICYENAQQDGVGHARLPLDLYFKFKTRKVLTIDQVYLIFLRLSEGRSWAEAVMDTVPKRKGVELLEQVDGALDNSSSDVIADCVIENAASPKSDESAIIDA